MDAQDDSDASHTVTVLADGIAKAAQRAGIYNGEVSLDGPSLLMLLENLAQAAMDKQPDSFHLASDSVACIQPGGCFQVPRVLFGAILVALSDTMPCEDPACRCYEDADIDRLYREGCAIIDAARGSQADTEGRPTNEKETAPAHPAHKGEAEEVLLELVDALEAAKNGLEWYRDAMPEADSGADDEAMQQIDAALDRARAITRQQKDAAGVTGTPETEPKGGA